MNRRLAITAVVVAVPLMAPATGLASPEDGYYAGHTTQHRAMSFDVSAAVGGVSHLKYTWRGACDDGTSRTFATVLQGPYTVASDRFRAKRSNRTGSTSVSGKFVESGFVQGVIVERRTPTHTSIVCRRATRFSASIQPR
jgi:hypothetical protein